MLLNGHDISSVFEAKQGDLVGLVTGLELGIGLRRGYAIVHSSGTGTSTHPHGAWRPNSAERARLKQIFPTGVCDYSRDDVGRP